MCRGAWLAKANNKLIRVLMTELSLIVATANNNIIGKDNTMPWHLPADLAYFKKTTLGKPIIMGRKTYDSVGRPLPGRTNIVVTRDPAWAAEGVVAVQSLADAIVRAEQQALLDGADAVMVVGGAEIYRLALPQADRIVLTRVHGEVSGDAYFDLEQLCNWQEIRRQSVARGAHNSHAFTIIEYAKP